MTTEDPADYPDDRTGDRRRHMAAAGVEMESLRVVSFAHVISDPSAATEMARAAADLGYDVEVHAPDDGEGQWEVLCRREIYLSYRAIAECEAELAGIADDVGGAAAGWG